MWPDMRRVTDKYGGSRGVEGPRGAESGGQRWTRGPGRSTPHPSEANHGRGKFGTCVEAHTWIAFFGTLLQASSIQSTRMRARHTVHATPTFPVYSAAFISPGDLILGGGGGASKTGIKNKLVRHLMLQHVTVLDLCLIM